jgi:Asp-tRNA(Asn)/Glu-tRNA(Gln) amidotransferase B subunit
MSRIVEVNEEGASHLPPEVLGHAKPRTRYLVEAQGETLILRLAENQQPFWATATPEEWVADFRQWVASHRTGPKLPDEALRRETMYD